MARFAALLVLLAACSYDLDALRPDGGGGGMDARTDGPPPPPVDGPIADVPPVACMVDPECDDLDACNGIETCVEGTCQPGAAASCTDPDPCTIDGCDPTDGSCTFMPEVDGTSCGPPGFYCCDGACVDTSAMVGACGPSCMRCGSHESCVGGSCQCDTGFGNCDGSPETGCEADFDTDESNCGVCGNPCASGESCIGGSCDMCSGDAACNDSRTCTTDRCVGGMCENTIMSNRCFIDDVCYTSGIDNPTNPCQECAPATSQTTWTNQGGTCGPPSTVPGVCGGFTDVCDMTGTRTDMVTTPTCMSGACMGVITMPSSSCTRPSTNGVPCPDGTYCNGVETCGGGTCSVPGGYPCGMEGCREAGGCFNCGMGGEPCCAGRSVDDFSRWVCCGPDPGIVQMCCVNSDCDTVNYCPGGGSRWECLGGGCCFGPCDGSC